MQHPTRFWPTPPTFVTQEPLHLFFSARRVILTTALCLVSMASLAGTAVAQIHPPAEGVEMPEAYRHVLARDPKAFQFHRAWFNETNRVRRNRETMERRHVEGLSELSAGPDLQTAVAGTRRVPVLMGKFSNTAADPITRASLQQELFDGPWPTGTMTDFYHEISYNQLTMTGTVYNWVQVPQPDTYYEGTSGCNGLDATCGAHTGEFLKSVLDMNDAAIDFSQYDNDGPDGLPNSGDDDGFVDFVAFVQPERGGECGTTNIWSHRWVYDGWWGAPYTTNDARAGGGFIKVSDYTIQPALSCGGGQIEIGVFCHEFGHAFGLPDLYDTDGTSNGLGNWCLMASGSYGGDGAHPATPTHMSAWCKEQLGWVVPTVLCGDVPLQSIPQVETNPTVYKIYPHGISDTEYFLVENKRQTGFDTYLRTSGLAVWHIDNDQSGNSDETHKLVDLEEADGLNNLDTKANRGDAGDLFPGTSVNRNFNDTTNPNAKDYAGVNTGFSLSSISDAGNPMTAAITLEDCRILAWDYTVVDTSETANGNGFLDAGETAWLKVTAWNVGATHSGIAGTLSSLSGALTVNTAAASFGTISSGGRQVATTMYKVTLAPGTAAGTVLNLHMAFSGDGGSYTTQDDFSLTAGRTALVIDDDAGANRETWFTTPIAAAGHAVRTWSLMTSGSPRAGNLTTSSAVVWLCGQAYDNTLTSSDQEMINSYLAAGGRIFVTGQDIGYDLDNQGSPADRAFYNNTLKATFVLDDTNDNTMTGVGGDPIGSGLSFSINGGDGANDNDFPSQINTINGSSAVFQYAPGVIGGVRYAGSGRMVYSAFCFEGISTQADRNLVMSRILTWLMPSDITIPVATLTSPNGPGSIVACSPMNIAWTATDNVGVTGVDLYYSTDCGASYPHIIATGVANTGTYGWTPPASAGANCKVLVVARDAGGLRGTDVSDNCFAVSDTTAPVVTITAPLAGAVWTAGQVRNIQWTAVDACTGVDSVVVSLSRNGGSTWEVLGADEANDGTMPWTVAGTPTANAKVRVQAFDRTYGGVQVSGVFTIQDGIPPAAAVISPNGGEIWASGTTHQVRYSVSDAAGIDSTCVEYSMTNGRTWSPIACTTNDSLLAWVLPGTNSDSCLVRITTWDGDGNSTTDASNALFRIMSASAAPPDVTGLRRVTLFQNRPNPFRPTTAIAFYLPAAAAGQLSIYDLQGRKVRILKTGLLPAGYQELIWDGRDDAGNSAASGIFFYVLEAGDVREVRKMVMMK